MKLVCILMFCSIASVRALPQQVPEIVLYESDGDDNGYNFQYETSDGIARVEKGELRKTQTGEEELSVEGSYTYTDQQGKQHRVHYKADKTGFRIIPN